MTSAGLARASRAGGLSDLLAPYHDGSELYLVERPSQLGDEAVVRLRLPHASYADEVLLRYVADGEPRIVAARVDEERDGETWWRASFPLANPATNYRWLLAGGTGGYAWLNGVGAVSHDVPDADDFVLGIDPGGPAWHLESVVYEIFPDRFASSGLDVAPPAWALRRGWDDLPTGRGPATPFEWYGGDLVGVLQRLDHIESLGASVIYLSPFFPAGSTHRYDATSFDRVDPLLGGDEALVALVRAAHARGLRVIGDLTLNHVGDGHQWFRAALDDGSAPEREFFVFDGRLPNGYAAWLGVPSLPKLDWRSGELRTRMADVIRRWVSPPYDLDGWRIDVANMTGRLGDVDVNRKVARLARAALAAARPDGLLVAEHGYDFRRDLAPGGWHGVMNYAGFLRPAWWWLRSRAWTDEPFLASPAARYDGVQAALTMRAFRAGLPWDASLHSWTLLDSHDTARFRTVTESRQLQAVGVGLQMTTPGVPMVFAGDEVGLEGKWGEDGRRPMPWARPEGWDRTTFDVYRRLIGVRRSSDALARGSLRYAFVDGGVIAYLRETSRERLLCLASREDHEPVRLALGALGCRALEPVVGDEPAYDDGDAVMPADGPAFHIWRLV